MSSFSISQLQQFSGIKAHTIRMWEQRYNALQPNRSEGNTRYYDSVQLRRLLNIVSLMDAGYKVSELCNMPDDNLFDILKDQLQRDFAVDMTGEPFISQLIAAGMDFDEKHFEEIYSNCLLRFGMKNTYLMVLYPMLYRIGLMWTSDIFPPAQEHFISNILRKKLFAALDGLPPATDQDETWVLFLPEDEFHELGLLMANYLIRESGKKVVYLGANIPFQSLKNAVAEIAPTNLLLFWVHNNTKEVAEDYLLDLTEHFSQQNIYVSGSEPFIGQLTFSEKICPLYSVEALEKLLH